MKGRSIFRIPDRRNRDSFRCAATNRFSRELLPPPATFYARELSKLSRPSRGWARAICPFHKDRNPSLSVNLQTGGFLCFSCQAKGGSVIDFLMLRDGIDFKTAAKLLGAWTHGTPAGWHGDLARQRRHREERDATVNQVAHR